MATKSDKKKQTEAVSDSKAGESAAAAVANFPAVALNTKMAGVTTKIHQLIKKKACHDSHILDINGFAATAANGQKVFRLTDFMCPQGEEFNSPINVVATPIGSKPFFLTVKAVLVNLGTDVEITVFAWDANGVPAPNVSFNWRCRVNYFVRIFA